MAKRVITRSELLDRWRIIEEDSEDVVVVSSFDDDNNKLVHKEKWFADTFSYLIGLPSDTHIWCGSWDLMGPLLETFYNYFKDEGDDSPLKLLWKRISQEMRQCVQCISQHHQAQEMYSTEYEASCIVPLLKVLQNLDEERVTHHLKELNAKISEGDYDSELHNAEVVCAMYEVLTFPILLDDQSLANEFQIFIEAVDDSHELKLTGQNQYPGVYALLFLKSRGARSIGHRLAGHNGKLRMAADLEPLQPLLKKCIGYLEKEALPSIIESSRPRLQLERITVWLGIKALLGFLEPSAFEEGILERYPSIVNLVLDHASDDSLEFSHAINCLRLLFEMLGCKLWLRTTLSPSVMHNTLVGQCFHTRNEKSHKEIFDLFEPFLQSLEALQDGEHEKQRRHFLYFFLHQVNMSSNFSVLMRKKACQIALRIIHRGYKMNPPCPPFECAHMWGPSLIRSLKDSSLHCSFRQPAFDLIHTIIISDAAALISSMLNVESISIGNSNFVDFNEDEDEILFSHDVEEKDASCWSDFSAQCKLTSGECIGWMCVPMLWFDILVEVQPSALPISFSKAVLWSLSRFSLLEPENITETALSVEDWLQKYAGTILTSFGWEAPTGSDDGGDGKVSNNSLKVSEMCLPLIKTFKRCAAHYVVQLENGKLWKQWKWEPSMAESLTLLLLDPNDNVRQVDRLILEHVSNTKGLATGLQFLCSSGASLSAVYLGLIHALKLVQLENVVSKFPFLHHFLFVLRKFLKDVTPSPENKPGNPVGNSSMSTFSSQGGFLPQPDFDASPLISLGPAVDLKSWESFSRLLSESMWPSVKKLLLEGKKYASEKPSQMTCLRLLELVPIVFEKVTPSVRDACSFDWLRDLVDWGKSSILVVVIYWKKSVVSLMRLLEGSYDGNSATIIGTIEKLMLGDNVELDDLKEQVSRLSLSLPSDMSSIVGVTNSKSDHFIPRGFVESNYSMLDAKKPFEHLDVEVLDSIPLGKQKSREKFIVLSDDEGVSDVTVSSRSKPSYSRMDDKTLDFAADKSISPNDHGKKSVSEDSNYINFLSALESKDTGKNVGLTSQTHYSDARKGVRKETNTGSVIDLFPAITKVEPLKKSSVYENMSSKTSDQARLKVASGSKVFPAKNIALKDIMHDNNIAPCEKALKSAKASSVDENISSKTSDQACLKVASGSKVLPAKNIALKDVMHDNTIAPWEKAIKSAKAMKMSGAMETEKRPSVSKIMIPDDDNDPWEMAVKAARRPQSLVAKLNTLVTKRQVIQLNMAMENKSAFARRMDAGAKRLKPPRLDDWYRPMLEIDYFSVVGLSPRGQEESETSAKLKKVPMCFESPDHYVDIFRPLVLEEFKAQLRTSYAESSSSEEMCSNFVSVVSVDRVDDFNLVRCVPSDGESIESKCSENDLVLLSRQPLQNSAQDVHVVGKVDRREKDHKRRSIILVIRLYLQNGSTRFNKAKRLLVDRSKWHLTRIMSLTSQLREFQALSSLNDIPVLPVILKPTVHSHDSNKSRKIELGKLSEPLARVLKSSFNDSQLQAISDAISNNVTRRDLDLSLIQGPPGTGKTRTILAIVSALLALPPPRRIDASMNTGTTSYNNNPRAMSNQSIAISRAWQDADVARQLSEGEDNSKSMENIGRGRVLICAQSNAAVDELVSRISNTGLYGSDGKMYKPYLVRVGNQRTVHPCSLPFFIDTLVDQRVAEEKMNENDEKNDLNGDASSRLRASLEKLSDRIRFYETKRANLKDGNSDSKHLSEDGVLKVDDVKEMSDEALGETLQKLYEQKRQICRDLGASQSRDRKASEEIRALRNKIRKSILKEAKIVVTTLSGCGGDLYGVCSESIPKFGNSSEHTLFDAVVIDEAAQALEPATLIPLQLLKSNGTKCIMVGDPKQLPATVLSQVASKYLYECSMFERLQRAGHPVTMLTKQYRMHPEICQFPSLHFYDNKLLNGEQMASKSAPFHEDRYLGPYLFFDVAEGQESRGRSSGSQSLCNESEAEAAVEVLRFFKKRYPTEFVGGRMGVISPYKSQVSLLRSRFSSAFGPASTADMEFNTVDGYQGREVDILILSTVRASDLSSATPGVNTGGIGFVADVRRMNVALTRAKLALWVFGNAATLQNNRSWGALVKNAENRNLIVSLNKPYWSVFKKSFSDSQKRSLLPSSNAHYKHAKPRESIRTDTTKCTDEINHNSEKASECMAENTNYEFGRNKNRPSSDDMNKIPIKEDLPFEVDAQQKGRKRPKDVKDPVTAELAKFNQAKGKEIVRKQDEKSRSVTKSVPLQQETVTTDETLHQTGSGISLSSIESKDQEGEVKDDGKGTSTIETPTKGLIARRKRQRDAVDALLPSAFIPSKKIGTAELPKFNQAKGKEIARKQDEKSRSVTKSVPLQQETVTTDETLHQTRSGISLSSIESQDQEGEVKDDGKGTSTIETPTKGLIARRKRQREAVDALLPSAFIPSKKIGTRQKSEFVKRPRSPTAAASGAQIKPPKPKKGTPQDREAV